MEQNTDAWLEWRRKGIGGSDAPAVMGVSPYMTPRQLFYEKIGVQQYEANAFVTDLGHKFEPVMRADFELEHGYSISPQCVQHSELGWLRASLDGFNEEKKVFVEIKYVGEEKLNWILEHKAPLEIHFPQIQHQFLVTGFQTGFYLAYTLTPDRKKVDRKALVKVDRDRAYIDEVLLPKLIEFWNCVQTQTPPPMSDKDVKVVKERTAIDVAEYYFQLLDNKKQLEVEIETLKESLLNRADHPTVQIGCAKITRVIKKGSVDYRAIPQLKGLDLDQFRKAPTSYWKIEKA